MRVKRLYILCLIILSTLPARAMLFDVNAFYFSDAFAPASGTTMAYNYTTYDVRLGFSVDKKQRFYIGWNYSGVTISSQNNTTTNQYGSTEMGPSFLWVLSKDKTWILSATYNLSSLATYAVTGATTEKWRGSTLKAYLGYSIQAGESWFLGPTINYYSATFNEKIIDDTEYATTSHTRSMIYPGFYLGFRF